MDVADSLPTKAYRDFPNVFRKSVENIDSENIFSSNLFGDSLCVILPIVLQMFKIYSEVLADKK